MSNIELDLRVNKIDFSINLLERVENKIKEFTDEFTSYGDNETTMSLCKENKQDIPESEPEPIDPELALLNRSGLRKLYHTIARKMHPDINDLDISIQETTLLSNATKHYNARDLPRLIKIAQKMDIDINDYITEVDFPLLDYNLEKIQESINNNTDSEIWKISKKTFEERMEFAKNFWKKRSMDLKSAMKS